MGTLIDVSKLSWETNSELWGVEGEAEERHFKLVDNSTVDEIGGKVLIFKTKFGNYRMRAEMCFLGHHLPEGTGGWFGFVMRARDTENYELVWFMPFAEEGKSAAYLSVAHGIVPWWTEAYAAQEKGGPRIQPGEWFETKIEVVEDEFTLFVDNERVFNKKLTYYLAEGYPGFYVGTATDATFRKVEIEHLGEDNR